MAKARSRRAGHEHHKFAFQSALRRDLQKCRRFAAQKFLEFFRQLARQHHVAVGIYFVQFAEQFFDTIRRFVENQSGGNRFQRFQFVAPLTGFVRKKSGKIKFIRRQAARGQAGDERAPTTDSTRKPAAMAALTTRSPGSLMPGLPASVISATFSPRRNRSMISSLRFASLN